ncbi:MAG: hypothetical protein MMC23_004068 [Stictis urceolatum]|nr:hypothetical protein [Stictis urceolata]
MSSYVCGCPASSYLNNREDWGVPAIDPTDLPPASCKDHGGPLDKISKETILRALDQPAEDPHMTWSTTNPHGNTARGYRANSQKKAEIEQNLEKNSLERMQVDTTNDDHARVLLAKDRFEQAHSRVAVAWTQKQEQERQSKAKLEGAEVASESKFDKAPEVKRDSELKARIDTAGAQPSMRRGNDPSPPRRIPVISRV